MKEVIILKNLKYFVGKYVVRKILYEIIFII